MALELRYLPAAQQDLLDTVDWIAADSPERARAWKEELDVRIQVLKDAPGLGRKPRNERIAKQGYRILVLDEYLVFYGSNEKEIIIFRVLRGTRNYEAIL